MNNVLAKLACGLLVLGAIACSQKKDDTVLQPPSDTSFNAEPANPDEALATQLSEGSVQMAGASESLQSALKEAKRVAASLKGEAHEGAQDIVDFLDDAGEAVAEAAADPPTKEDIKKDFAASDDSRKKRIQDGNDAYRSMEQSLGTLESLRSGVDGLETLGDLITLAMDDLGDAIEAYGGVIESEQEDKGPDPEKPTPASGSKTSG